MTGWFMLCVYKRWRRGLSCGYWSAVLPHFVIGYISPCSNTRIKYDHRYSSSVTRMKSETGIMLLLVLCAYSLTMMSVISVAILCLTSRTTVTSARIPEEDACHRARNLCVFSHVQKGTPGLTHKLCVLQRLSFSALSDVTVVLEMRQSIVIFG